MNIIAYLYDFKLITIKGYETPVLYGYENDRKIELIIEKFDISVDMNWDKNVFETLDVLNNYIAKYQKGSYTKCEQVPMKPFKGYVSEFNN